MIQLFYTISTTERQAARAAWVQALGRNAFGAPQCRDQTAWFSDPVRIPMKLLGPEAVRSRGGDQARAPATAIARLRDEMSATGRFPMAPDGVTESVPGIDIAYDGTAWVAAGDARLAIARELGWRWAPVAMTYFDGGEHHAGALRPNALLFAQYHQQLPDRAPG